MPLSRRTLEGLTASKLTVATEIQAAAIPHSLAGRDVLGAAKTGSGKTLSFVVPILEKLYRERWTQEDGLGAIVISPTRELALQIFEVLRTVGRKHQFSAGLVTGGKKEFDGEQERIVRMNILIATPGRLLQHMEQTPGFDSSRVMMLVLDEADRILDMGFRHQLDSILEYLPLERQTMLFSATQTKSVKDLARLSLKTPEFLAVHAEDDEVTPKQLVQNYVVCQLQDKLDILFSFIKSHLKSKIIVFFSTCSQVRFVHECFCGMQPGIPLTALHGKIKQERRTIIYMDFLKRPAACLFATDIAARGLDFPNVDWVIQVDAPEDSAMYIHRVGRTARYTASGRALLLLMPQEEQSVLQSLQTASIPIKKLTVNPNRKFSVSTQAAALLAAQPEYRLFAKKAFTSYLRSLQMLPQYPIADISTLPVSEFATSLGLPFTPELPILAKDGAAAVGVRDEIREKKNVNRALDKLRKQIKDAKEMKKRAKEEAKRTGRSVDEVLAEMKGRPVDADSEDSDSDAAKDKKRTKKLSEIAQEIQQKKQQQQKSSNGEADSDDDEDDFLTVKRVHHWNEEGDAAAADAEEPAMDVDGTTTTTTTAAEQKKKAMVVKIKKDGSIKVKNAPAPKKTVFDDEGNTVDNTLTLQDGSQPLPIDETVHRRIAEYAQQVKSVVDEGRQADEDRDKQRLRDAKLKRKQAERDAKMQAMGVDAPVLASAVEAVAEEEEDGGSYGSDSGSDSDDDGSDSDSGSDDDDSDGGDSDSDNDSADSFDADHAAKFKANQGVAQKRKRNVDNSSSEEDGSDSDSDDDSDSSSDRRRRRPQTKKAKKPSAQELEEQERLALQLLSGGGALSSSKTKKRG